MELWRAHWIDADGFEDESSPRQLDQAQSLGDNLARNASVGRVWLQSTAGKRVEVPFPEKRVK